MNKIIFAGYPRTYSHWDNFWQGVLDAVMLQASKARTQAKMRCSANTYDNIDCNNPVTYRCAYTEEPSYWCDNHAGACCVPYDPTGFRVTLDRALDELMLLAWIKGYKNHTCHYSVTGKCSICGYYGPTGNPSK